MAIVVPEGFLFRKDLAKTREYLLDHCQLQSIISLPQNVFLPYTGVKTDIIYATKVNKKFRFQKKRKIFGILMLRVMVDTQDQSCAVSLILKRPCKV
ncbi:MAG: N-6 DNA methylase [Faecalibacterium prausnitzii]